MYDIIAMIWFCVSFIVNLLVKGSWKGIPSVFFNLRHGGSALIDRKTLNKPIPDKVIEYIEK
jgi:1-acyl-sn-glycerol-3-phosphate acyltransferase